MIAFVAASPALADTATSAPATAPPSTSGDTEASNNFSIVRYRADYQVRPDAGNVQTETYEVLLKTKASVEQFSQVRLSYSEKMETLEVLGAYTITADGQRRDVPADRIYTQESYSSASAAMYADRKVRVIVFPNLAPGTRLYYQVRRTQTTPYFPGYFGLWETFNVFTEYEDAEVTLSAPANLPMCVDSRGVQGSDRPTVKNGQAQWRWRYQRREAMPAQNWSAADGARLPAQGGPGGAGHPGAAGTGRPGDRRHQRPPRAGRCAVPLGGAEHPLCGGVPGQRWPGAEQRAEHPRQPLWRLQGPGDDPGGAAGGKGHRQFASADRSGRWPDPAEDSGTGPLQPRHHLHSRV
ncbi:hypothetical protein G6F68_010797 [Rhizopus microsporus]|nr:hypothetical protein G6F68_010797 [Rhizopus microsporus]